MITGDGTRQTYIRFARKGTTVNSVVSGIASKPPVSPTPWREIGAVLSFSRAPQLGTAIDVVKPSGGSRKKTRKIRNGPCSIIFTFPTADTNALTLELMSMAGPIDDSAATTVGAAVNYTPFAGLTDPIEGWWQLVEVNDAGEVIQSEDHWGEATLGGPVTSGEQLTAPQWSLEVFPNALSAGTVWKTSV